MAPSRKHSPFLRGSLLPYLLLSFSLLFPSSSSSHSKMVGLFILAVEIVATLTIVAIPVAYYILGRKRM